MQIKAGQKHIKKIGIIGGMGPMATLDLYDWIIKLTPARKDQDHLPVIINNAPQIPDRTSFLLGEGRDPRPEILSAALELERGGAKIIAMPCNTAHCFANFIQRGLKKAELINMLTETKKYLDGQFLGTLPKPKLGLLATTGTIKTNLYQKYFQGWHFILPDETTQNSVMDAIYGKNGIKSGRTKYPRQILRQAAEHLHKNGAEVIILGCSEISLSLKNEKNNSVCYINPIKILAKALVGKCKPN